MTHHDFSALHAAMRAQVDQQFLPGVSTSLLHGRDVVDRFCYGFADREAGTALREDHIFRVFSNTKLVTSCAVMLLLEDGRIKLDDPIEAYIPELGGLQVLRPGATRIDDTEPAKSSITIRHLMTHTSGLSYGIFDPGTLQFAAYNQRGVANRTQPLADMMTALVGLPLSFQPGTQWEYSVATDVLARLVEIVCGKSFGEVLRHRIFEPLGMVDTDFWVPEAKRERLCAPYMGVELTDPTKPGLVRADDKPYPGAYTSKMPRESGGGGLVSTLGDTVRLLQSLIPGGPTFARGRDPRAHVAKPVAGRPVRSISQCASDGRPRLRARFFGRDRSGDRQSGRSPRRGRLGWAGGNDLVDQPAHRHRRGADDATLVRLRQSLRHRVQAAGLSGTGVLIAHMRDNRADRRSTLAVAPGSLDALR